VTGTLGYRARRDSDRCEGLYETQVGGGGLELVDCFAFVDYKLTKLNYA
jgi:hypothetical protein